jgi:hypothetical protein
MAVAMAVVVLAVPLAAAAVVVVVAALVEAEGPLVAVEMWAVGRWESAVELSAAVTQETVESRVVVTWAQVKWETAVEMWAMVRWEPVMVAPRAVRAAAKGHQQS